MPIISYIPKFLYFRPWNLAILSTAPLILVYMYYSQKRGFLSLNLLRRNIKLKGKIEDKSQILMDQLKEYKNTILIANEDECKRKILMMQSGGPELLQIISDFDWTMSRYKINGKCNINCHDFFGSYPGIPEEVKEEHTNLSKQYYPIEVNPAMTNDEKTPYMVEWWTKSHDLIVSNNLNLPMFEETVRNCRIPLRDGCEKFLETLHSSNIPLLIFSAGIGNVIDTLLRQRRLLFDNVRIVSNFMNFNKENVLVGFQDSIIHCFNKNAKSIQDSEFYDSICTKRRNVLLIGDSTGDPHMSDGLADDVNVLKIGFLNHNVDARRDTYSAIYDIVVVSDETFTVPLLVLSAVLELPL